MFRRKVIYFLQSYKATESSSTETKFQKIKLSSATFYRRRMGDRTQGSSTFPLFQMSNLVTRDKSDEN